MSPGEVIAYRLYAVYCVEIARELADPGRKAALLRHRAGLDSPGWPIRSRKLGAQSVARPRITIRKDDNGGCLCHG
jgi:hypothetical protein